MAQHSMGWVLVLAVITGAWHGAYADEATVPPASDTALVAHWAFDEDFGQRCNDASGNGYDASPEGGDIAGFERVQGVYGNAASLSGHHRLRASQQPVFGCLDGIALSAWVLPTGFDQYTEIFRKEDGVHRVLFAFQEHGATLALGLFINGYVECDAAIVPESVLDGQWHHCAAAYDGQAMHVYLDGVEVGALDRPGRIEAVGDASGYIGSSNGGECFQGIIDDLRIYRAALSADEIAAFHTAGREVIARMAELEVGDEPTVDAPLLAHWTFNERGATTIIHDTADTPCADIETPILPRYRGVHGNALSLAGTHGLKADIGTKLKGLSEIAFSAWVKPTDLSGFREIFRQECDERLLFSFQGSGAILSLGLNVGGYQECDAEIAPGQVLDGFWHHCAGTFDGKTMRVYFDGIEVGHLERSGKLAARPEPPAFIGSSDGVNEHFQGALDDLRIYGAALAADQVETLYRNGREALARLTEEQEQMLLTFYAPADSFAETLADSRANLVREGLRLTRSMAETAVARITAQFPEDCRDFAAWTGTSPLGYLASDDVMLDEKLAATLVALLVEYRPLTDHQWRSQTPEQLERWKEVDAIQQRFDALKALGEAGQFSPEWIRIILEAGPRIQFRPFVSEPVAPYVTPATPETRARSADEAREALERDWLHQVDNAPTPERIRQQIAWTRQLATRIQDAYQDTVSFDRELAELAKLERRAQDLHESDAALYFEVRGVKRRIMFANPVVDFDRVLFVDMPFPQGSEWPHETRHRLGYMAVPGARLIILDGLSPEGRPQQLMPQPPMHGSFWRPDLSYDATQVLFCFKPHNEKSFHLYQIGVDGAGLVQLTDGVYDDLDPIYLPDDEHILFSTTRGHTFVRCMPPTNAFVLARADSDGRNIYLISRGNEPDYLASVMDDGQVIYTRWEYTDKPLWRAQSLWTMHPDGTQVNTFWGNQSVWPDLLKDVRGIPGSHRVMFTGSAHHNWFSGSVGIIDPHKGLNFPQGLTKVTAETPWPECGNGPVDPVESPGYHADGQYAAYYSPYPLSENDFIVSANRGGKFVLYLMDVDGNRELIYEGAHHILHALPVRPRVKPPVLSDQVAWPTREERLSPKGGVIYSNSVYQGAPEALRGNAKYLRVLNIEHKTYTYWSKRPYLSTGPVVSGVQSEGVKRVLGTVPIEPDGSVTFYAPSGIPLHFQLLDENQRALQTMRSFTGVMPGERRGCLGCHARHSRAPLSDISSLAAYREPSAITPPPWGVDSVSYDRYVRPALDQYCGKCHQGDGKARQKVDFTARPGFLGFDESYWLLTGKPAWGEAYQAPENPPPGFGIAGMIMVEGYDQRDPMAYQTPEPMTMLSYQSKLIEIASSGKHHNLQVDPISLQKLILWVDTMCPYLGSEEVRAIPDPDFQGIDWLAFRPQIQHAPCIVRPGPVDGCG
ncbi:MAG TPA: hypothetical protein PLO37_22760 [Candidatus Hydrogenedentes bacterium]|nr:hypothetical protein [Candidatus Hydrogenedentota bacterium]HPG69679.1 hypothetical protein [Candidatus Hydrogenedentota bacterium]